jgi:ABC-type transport system involved in multi-copper enzyme maturation permease subunit
MNAWLLRRELSIVFRSRATWLALAVSALLVGHGFVLAVDLFAAASESALRNAIMKREMDPLAGLIRPTLGGLQLATALLLPVIAARGLAVERERRTYGALALRALGTERVVAAKLLAAIAAGAVLLATPVLLFLAFRIAGGHVYALELFVALSAHGLHVAFIATASVAAAAATRTVAQAITLGVLISMSSWAIEASDGFAALAWMGSLDWAVLGKRIEPLEQGVLSIGSVAWFAAATLAMVCTAFALGRIGDAPREIGSTALALAGALVALYFFGHEQRAYDCSESRRMSLPGNVVQALREDQRPITLTVWLDREDGRRTQVERDALAKLRLARPDMRAETPLDDLGSSTLGAHGDEYGRIVVRVGTNERETRSTSRRELLVLIFEAMERPFPDWSQPSYPGYPFVARGGLRTLLVTFAYAVLPLLHIVLGWMLTRPQRRLV